LLSVLVRSYGKQAAAGLALFLLGWLLGRRGVTASRDTPPHP
jgi:hypothetical protein